MASILRATFKKGETLRYTGHLDILRTFVRGLRRAEIPVKYSEGFNPHAILTFAIALGVGVTSECEIVDIALTEEMDTKDFISRVNSSMPDGGIEIISAEYTDGKAPEFTKAEYEIKIENSKTFDVSELENALKNPIIVEKKSKRQTKEVDLSEHIFGYEITDVKENTFALSITVSAGNRFNIKPQLLIDGLKSVCQNFDPVLVLPHRKKFIFE